MLTEQDFLDKIKFFRPKGLLNVIISKNEDGTWGGSHRTMDEMLSYETYEALDSEKKVIVNADKT